MKTAASIVLAVGLLVVGVAIGRLLPGGAAHAPVPAGPKVIHYTCPMHPSVKADGPGTAPCCGMALEPVHEGGGGAARAIPGAVTMSAELRQRQGVRVGTASRSPGRHTLRLFGRVVPDDTRVHVVEPAVEGTARQVSGATVGSFVKKGEKLGTFFSADIRSSFQSYLSVLGVVDSDAEARSAAGLSPIRAVAPNSAVSFATERLRTMGVSDDQIEEMRRTRQPPLEVQLRSPVNGVVIGRDFLPGQRIGPGMECFRIANVERVWVMADVAGADAPGIRPGATARVRLPGSADGLAATVSDVPPRFDPESRTFKLRLDAANPRAELRPDMFVDVEVDVVREEAVTVPADAVLDAGVRKTVFVESGDGTFEPRQVETGWRAGGEIAIVRGLSAGERVVVSGTFMVDSESQLRAATAAAEPPADRRAPAAAAAPVDPICGMTVDAAKAEAAGRAHVHDGKTYHFCSDGCLSAFAKEPARFARADLAHGSR
jgi:RND family efflux transporter MFP subunit